MLMDRGRDNICKGYSNVGIIRNLEHSISSISSVPATFEVSVLFSFIHCGLSSFGGATISISHPVVDLPLCMNR